MQQPSEVLQTLNQPRPPINVLIAEDHPGNQQLLRELLEPLGCVVAVAENGRQAVRLVQEGAIDIVLMDLQMPEMDGFQATQAIRELSPPKSAVPVIAVTSLSPVEDAEWRKTGISDYLAKPVDKAKLRSILESWILTVRQELPAHLEQQPQMPANNRNATPLGQGAAATDAVMVLEIALARMGNDRALLLQLAEFFLEDAPKLLQEIEGAIHAAEPEVAGRAAHSLKGLAANFEAIPAVTAARRLEDDGRRNDLSQLPADLAALRTEIDKLMQALSTELRKSRS